MPNAARKEALLADPPYLDAPAQKALADRLARIQGHVGSLRRMVIEQRCADEILLQVAAVKAALNQVSGQIIDRELNTCVTSCMPDDAEERLKKVTKALTSLLKQG